MALKPEPIYGKLPAGWELMTVAHLVEQGFADIQTGPFGTMLHASAHQSTGVPVVAVKNIAENRLDHEAIPRVSPEVAAALSRYELQVGDIVFGRKGAVERRALIRPAEQGWLQGSDCIRLRLTGSVLDPTFASFVLGTPQYRSWIARNAQGATMPSLNQEIISRIPLPAPSYEEQQALAEVFLAFDEKLDLNRRMNQTLEAMARAIFKSWFVDFDPVHESHPLFPTNLTPSSIGLIPTGWIVRPIGEAVAVVGGSTPSTESPEYWNGSYNFAAPKDLSRLTAPILLETERTITEEGLNQISSGLLPTGTVLLSSRAPIGYLAITEIPVAINQGFIAMICNSELHNYYVFEWARQNMDTIVGYANGTTFLEISKRSFRPIPILVPPKPILDHYGKLVSPLFARIGGNLRESRTLAALRDTLLPKLLSGEIRIKQAEKMVAKAV